MAKLRQSVQLAEQGQKELAAQNAAASESFTKALALWPNNELAKRLKTDAATLKAAATPAPIAEAPKIRAATPVPSTPRPVVKTVVQDEPAKPFLLTLGGIITIIVVLALILGGWMAFKKIKSRASDVLE